MGLGLFAAVFVALFAAHQVADHWVQAEHQAATKGLPGRAGQWACLKHVLTYKLTGYLALWVLVVALDAQMSMWQIIVGMNLSALSHYFIDRRAPLKAMAVAAGHREFHDLGKPRPGRDDNPSLGTGAYALDQSAHYLFLFIAALIIAA